MCVILYRHSWFFLYFVPFFTLTPTLPTINFTSVIPVWGTRLLPPLTQIRLPRLSRLEGVTLKEFPSFLSFLQSYRTRLSCSFLHILDFSLISSRFFCQSQVFLTLLWNSSFESVCQDYIDVLRLVLVLVGTSWWNLSGNRDGTWQGRKGLIRKSQVRIGDPIFGMEVSEGFIYVPSHFNSVDVREVVIPR